MTTQNQKRKRLNGNATGGDFVTEVVTGFDEARADYAMSKQSRFNRRRKGLAPQGGGADYHYRNEPQFYDDIEKARDMERNDAIGGQLLDRFTQNVVQEGYALNPNTGDTGLDRYLKDRWAEESCDPELTDIAGELCWHDYEHQAVRSMMRDGDCLIIGTEDGPFQFIEAHAIRTDGDKDDTVLGVELNEYRRKVRFWIQQDELNPDGGRFDEASIDVRDNDNFRQAFHVLNPKRTTATRGKTAYAPLFEKAGLLEDIEFAKLVQQQLVSCFAILRNQAAGAQGLPSTDNDGDDGYGDQSTMTSPSGQTRVLEGVAPGMEITSAPGETLDGFSPNIPNAEYFQQAQMITQLMSTSWGVPLMVLLLDASQTNFSGWRGALDEARKGFRYHQHNLVKRLHSPAYRWRVKKWLETDVDLQRAYAKPEIQIFRHKFNLPAWPYIEPLKDATTDIMRVKNGLISPRRLHAERARDHDEITRETIDDNALAIETAILRASELTRQLGTPVHWRELLSLPAPDGVQINVQPDQKNDQQLNQQN